MATVHVSPGAYFQTTDLSAYIPRLTQSSYGVIGRFRQGPTDPTVISDTQTFFDVFGYPEEGMYSALSALLYLNNGNQLYVKRLVGMNARKAVAEIPAGSVVQEEEVVTADGRDYQFHLGLAHTPLPGTLVLYIGNNRFYDNGSGKIIGGATSLYCNYIDYDTGVYRFTLAEAPEDGDKVEIRYNGKLFIITNENVGATDGTTAFSAMLKRTGVYFPDFETKVVVDVDGRVLEGNTFDSNGMIVLSTPANSGSTLNDTGLVDPETGAITIDFDSSDIPAAGKAVYVNYDTFTESKVQVGTGDGVTRSFSGIVSDRVSPGTSSIWVNDELVSEDQRTGDYTGTELVYSDNTVDYTTGTIKLALTFEPDEGTIIKATYSTKAETVLYIFDEDSTSKTITGQIDVSPVIKGSVEVFFEGVYLADDGEGYLVGTGGNGTIDYNTGEVKINLLALPEVGTPVRCVYLAKYGEMQALYEGEYGDNIKGMFSYKPDTGYNFEVWTQNQDASTDSPDEFWRNLDFANTGNTNYVTTKVSSYSVQIVPNTSSGIYLEPLLGQLLVTEGGESDIENVSDDEVLAAIQDFANPENYDINTIALPDFAGNKKIAINAYKMCETRGECFCVIDTPEGLTPRQAVDWTNAQSSYNGETKIDTSFGAVYYPWVYVNNPVTGMTELVPPSTVIPSTYTYSDNLAAAWYAPAGITRGIMSDVVGLERRLSLEDRDLVYGYPNIINPLIEVPNQGFVIWGQKTAQRKSTALDRVHVRRLINYISKVMATAFMELVFEPNDHITWTKYKQIVQPILEQIQTDRGLYDCMVVCDSTTNTDEIVEKNEMHAKVYLQPLKTVEVIETEYILNGTGTTYES